VRLPTLPTSTWSSYRATTRGRATRRRLSPSYVNFYVANGGIVLPAFDDPADEEARDIVARLFPRHAVVPVPTLELAKADGNVHCITQQQPAR